MKTAFARISILAIIVATIGVGLNILFKESIVTYIDTETISGITYYHYNFYGYVKGIINTLDGTPMLALTLPTRQWSNNYSDIVTGMQTIANNLGVILNVMIVGLNIMLYPFRIVFYVIKLALTLLGINMQANGTSLDWLKTLADTMIKLQIPYV